MRLHHLRKTAETAWPRCQASTDPQDQTVVAVLDQVRRRRERLHRRSAGAANTRCRRRSVFLYDPPSRSLDAGRLDRARAAPGLQLSPSTPTPRSCAPQSTAKAKIASSTARRIPELLARKGIGDDFLILAPLDPTYTDAAGWTGHERRHLDGARSIRRSIPALLPAARRRRSQDGARHRPRSRDAPDARIQQLDRRRRSSRRAATSSSPTIPTYRSRTRLSSI